MSQPYPTIEEVVCAKLLARAKVGLSKYGVSLADAKLTRMQALIHAQEEALDLANYLEVEIQREQSIDRESESQAPAEVESIPWAEYPWAKWAVANDDGIVWMTDSEVEPTAIKQAGGWIGKLFAYWECAENATIPGPWQDSLRKRPEGI